MPGALSRSDKKALIVGAAVLGLLIAAGTLFSSPEEDYTPYPSSYTTGAGGGKAAYLLLQESGYSIERWEQPPDQLPSPDEAATVLLLAQPFDRVTSREREALESWIRRGGILLATGYRANSFLPERAANFDYEIDVKEFSAGAPSNLNQQIPHVTMKPEGYWDTKKNAAAVIFGDEEHAVVISYIYGKGRVIWWSGSTPLTNAGLKHAGNMELLLSSVGPPENRRILWDEYFHGQRPDVWSYLGATPLLWGLAQLGLGVLAVFFTYSRRSGPVRPLVAEPRLSPLEFVDGLGGLYQRAHAASAAVKVAHQRFRYLLIKRLGLASNASTKELNVAVRERMGWREPGFIETLQHCERAELDPELNEDNAVQLVQALQQYTRVLRLSPRTQKERTDGSSRQRN
jgi:hypothetical protein